MRLDLHLVPKRGKTIKLPKENLYMVQAMLYGLFEKSFAEALHDVGFKHDKRRFKLFAFSWPKGQGRPRLDGGYISFTAPLTVVVTSPMNRILEQISGGALCGGDLRLGQNELECSDVKVHRPKVEGNSLKIKALSPITCYTTDPAEEGKKGYVRYHRPDEDEFVRQIDGNLRKKFSLMYPSKEIPADPIGLTPLEDPRKQVGLFRPKDTVPIVGYWGRYRLEGPQELLQLAVDAGIGAKNPGGWGCLEVPER
ncbi:CRISPR-associated protein Cas6 [Dethiosulfovibrio peptidovorans DSM 11002]|uniref:CRISPR-associated endoribonuclease n=1 Tax=Dethiosulfovibrio peptidovorans DSM 11002 TaxID=469381 RepID=D2Z4J3_9BACT|nr:CRISPR-associated endoribonuclease Cas6 [Dethiosulfovibrio peptidovorans]EFC90522.1 CRISPR-associated protein Cas6 [Dethiosulfovibrio peptidovorans DSM 11002]